MSETPPPDWSNATWEGNRRAQLRATLALTVRERLLAMEALGELSDTIAAATGRGPVAEVKTGRA
ncbi:MAG TPA: hypothetical protein VIS77_02355 [Burkholderiales bacterium]